MINETGFVGDIDFSPVPEDAQPTQTVEEQSQNQADPSEPTVTIQSPEEEIRSTPKKADADTVIKTEAEERARIDALFAAIDSKLIKANKTLPSFMQDIRRMGSTEPGLRKLRENELRAVTVKSISGLEKEDREITRIGKQFQSFRQQFSQLNGGEGIDQAELSNQLAQLRYDTENVAKRLETVIKVTTTDLKELERKLFIDANRNESTPEYKQAIRLTRAVRDLEPGGAVGRQMYNTIHEIKRIASSEPSKIKQEKEDTTQR